MANCKLSQLVASKWKWKEVQRRAEATCLDASRRVRVPELFFSSSLDHTRLPSKFLRVHLAQLAAASYLTMAPAVFDVDALNSTIPTIFDQAQSSGATHKKNCVALYKLQSSSAKVTSSASKGRKQTDADSEVLLIGEKRFVEVFLDMLSRVLVVKKGAPAADRVVKFVGTYVKFLSEKCT